MKAQASASRCFGIVYGATGVVIGVMLWAVRFAPDIFEYLMYWVIATLQLGWFGGYHDRDPADRQGIELHRRANVLVAGITMWLLCYPGGFSTKVLGVATLALAVLGALRPPARTRHLSIGAATTMILMPPLIVYENTWAAPFAVAARRSGGQLVAGGRIPIQAFIAALDAAEAA